jgi:hypothetical protein
MRGRQLLLARTEARHHLLPPLDPVAASLYARGGPHGLRGWGAPMRGRSGLCRGSRACEAKGTHVRCKGGIGGRRSRTAPAVPTAPHLMPCFPRPAGAAAPSSPRSTSGHSGTRVTPSRFWRCSPARAALAPPKQFLGPLLCKHRSPAPAAGPQPPSNPPPPPRRASSAGRPCPRGDPKVRTPQRTAARSRAV